MMGPADCQQRPGAHYRRNAVLALSTALLLAGCGGNDNVRPSASQRTPQRDGPIVQPADPTKANAVLMRAISLVGTPYRYGGNTPEGGFDCSGLVTYVFRDMLDLRLPRTSRELAATQGPRIATDRLAGGDLVFFGSGGQVSHVGIYVGEGRFLHSPSTGKDVRVDSLVTGYWSAKFMQARRVTM